MAARIPAFDDNASVRSAGKKWWVPVLQRERSAAGHGARSRIAFVVVLAAALAGCTEDAPGLEPRGPPDAGARPGFPDVEEPGPEPSTRIFRLEAPEDALRLTLSTHGRDSARTARFHVSASGGGSAFPLVVLTDNGSALWHDEARVHEFDATLIPPTLNVTFWARSPALVVISVNGTFVDAEDSAAWTRERMVLSFGPGTPRQVLLSVPIETVAVDLDGTGTGPYWLKDPQGTTAATWPQDTFALARPTGTWTLEAGKTAVGDVTVTLTRLDPPRTTPT